MAYTPTNEKVGKKPPQRENMFDRPFSKSLERMLKSEMGFGQRPLDRNGSPLADESPLSLRWVHGAISEIPLLSLSRVIGTVDPRSQHPSIVSPRGVEGCNRVVAEDAILCD